MSLDNLAERFIASMDALTAQLALANSINTGSVPKEPGSETVAAPSKPRGRPKAVQASAPSFDPAAQTLFSGNGSALGTGSATAGPPVDPALPVTRTAEGSQQLKAGGSGVQQLKGPGVPFRASQDAQLNVATPVTEGAAAASMFNYEQHVKPMIMRIGTEKGRDTLVAVLQRWGIKKGSDLPPAQFNDFVPYAEKVLGGMDPAASEEQGDDDLY